jgi:FSR family fosmidomycin resistance protein-like MFS transporter
MLAGILPILFPVVKDRFDIGNAEVGLLTLAYAGTASLFQPLFGHVADRISVRWLPPVILLWSSLCVAAYGSAGSLALLFALAAAAGLGSAAYHPVGASNAALVSDPRTRNASLSIYTVGGTLGYALGPLVAVALISAFGARGTAGLLVPGVVGALFVWRGMATVVAQRRLSSSAAPATAAPTNWFLLARIIGIVMLRSWAFLALLQFVPVWFDDLGYSRSFYGPLATTIILAGAAGTMLGGALADRSGGRVVIIGSQLLCVPALLLFAGYPGALSFVFGALFGLLSDSSLAVTLTSAQRLLPGRTGLASGVILGLGFVTGGIGVPITGLIADHVGISAALASLSLLAVGAAAMAWTVPAKVFTAERITPAPQRQAAAGPAVS